MKKENHSIVAVLVIAVLAVVAIISTSIYLGSEKSKAFSGSTLEGPSSSSFVGETPMPISPCEKTCAQLCIETCKVGGQCCTEYGGICPTSCTGKCGYCGPTSPPSAIGT